MDAWEDLMHMTARCAAFQGCFNHCKSTLMKGAQSKRNRSAKSVKVESAGPFSIALSNKENCVKYLPKTFEEI